MNQATGKRIIEIQNAALEDDFYKELLAEYEPISQRFAQVLRKLSPEHRAALEDYFGVTGAMHLRLMELAVERSVP